MKYLILMLFALAGCQGCGSPQSIAGKPDQSIITIFVQNNSDQTFYGTVSAGLLSKSVTVPPHETRSFWGYKTMVPDSVTFIVSDREAPAPAKRK